MRESRGGAHKTPPHLLRLPLALSPTVIWSRLTTSPPPCLCLRDLLPGNPSPLHLRLLRGLETVPYSLPPPSFLCRLRSWTELVLCWVDVANAAGLNKFFVVQVLIVVQLRCDGGRDLISDWGGSGG